MIPKPVSIIRPWNKSVHTTVFRPPYKCEQEIKLGIIFHSTIIISLAGKKDQNNIIALVRQDRILGQNSLTNNFSRLN